MTSMRVRETITLSWKLVTSNRKVMNPTMMRIVCWRNTPRRWYSIFLGEMRESFSTTGKVHLLKTIFTSATLISPESSINTAHCWISYSRRSFLPEPSFGLTCTFCCKYFVEKTCVVYSDVIFLQNNKLLSKSLRNYYVE